jgi:NAD dependent epimerase/dehydratase family enzyme
VKRVVIAGASGFMGTYLRESFTADGIAVTTIGRTTTGRTGADVAWGDADGLRRAISGTDLLLNLAGRSVNCRYGRKNREVIRRSRVDTTRELGRAIVTSDAPPAVWLNSSTATIYRHADDRPMTESTGELGTGFSVGVARAWEEAFFEETLPATRRVALRTAIVLGDGSALTPLLRLARFGLGGPQLDGRWPATRARREAGTYHEFRSRGGRQRFSWVHLADVDRAIRFIVDHPELDGVVNLSAPHPTDNRTMMAALRRVVGMPIGIPTPRWMLEIGSWLIRTETELVLKSRWVIPERLTNAGFDFAYPDLEPAVTAIISRRARGSR